MVAAGGWGHPGRPITSQNGRPRVWVFPCGPFNAAGTDKFGDGRLEIVLRALGVTLL
ncbi:hypothetical protein GCM10020220_017820 [Nonomuraea rubra]